MFSKEKYALGKNWRRRSTTDITAASAVGSIDMRPTCSPSTQTDNNNEQRNINMTQGSISANSSSSHSPQTANRVPFFQFLKDLKNSMTANPSEQQQQSR